MRVSLLPLRADVSAATRMKSCGNAFNLTYLVVFLPPLPMMTLALPIFLLSFIWRLRREKPVLMKGAENDVLCFQCYSALLGTYVIPNSQLHGGAQPDVTWGDRRLAAGCRC